MARFTFSGSRHGNVAKDHLVHTRMILGWSHTSNRGSKASQNHVFDRHVARAIVMESSVKSSGDISIYRRFDRDAVIRVLYNAVVNPNVFATRINPIGIQIFWLVQRRPTQSGMSFGNGNSKMSARLRAHEFVSCGNALAK